MAEVVHVFGDPMFLDGHPYSVQVAGRKAGHIWEGWIEFAAADGSEAWRSPRETTQPDRDALQYWATGLSPTYLEGAFRRALEPRVPATATLTPAAFFDSPAPHAVAADLVERDGAVLDPFSVGAKGEELLRRELGALRGWHLRNIIRAYDLAAPSVDLEPLSEPELVELIVQSVQPA
jgi:hypothetical protein